jgi:hypothetical protein
MNGWDYIFVGEIEREGERVGERRKLKYIYTVYL